MKESLYYKKGNTKIKEMKFVDLLDEIIDSRIYESQEMLKDSELGYCSKCIEQRWKTENEIQILYKLTFKNGRNVKVCKNHHKCYMIAKEMAESRKEPLSKAEIDDLKDLIEEGYRIINKDMIQ